MTQTLNICAINIGERCRTDFGDISDLAESIKAIGLLHPVVVTANHDLIAGERRLAAMARLMWTEIPVTIVDIDNAADALRAEMEENTCRRSLSAYEADVLREKRERVLAEEAKRRQRQHGSTAPGRPSGAALAGDQIPGLPEQNTSSTLDEVLPAEPTARATRKVAAIGTGYSGSTLDKVRTIRDAAERGVVKQGKTEIPIPEPVRDVAREAVEEIKRSGAAVNPAARRVEQALSGYVDEGSDVKAARLRKSTYDAMRQIDNGLPKLDAERVAEICDDEMWEALTDSGRRVSEWLDVVSGLRNGGLRLVKGAS